MSEIDRLKIFASATIREALEVIDQGSRKIALVVDPDNILVGTITDGDIRRGLLNGLTLDTPIDTIINRKPTVAYVNESKETIRKKLFHHNLYQIPVISEDGKLAGLESVNSYLDQVARTNKVVLMAGGLGTRLGELTKNTPKPMLEVGNKPILQTIIESFAKYNFTEICLSVNYLSEVIKDYFEDGSRFGVNITYVDEPKRLGTAGALDLIRDQLTEPFFVMNGDILTNINFAHLYDFHINQKSAATMCVREYDFQVPYGTVNIENGSILSIDEKPVHKFFVSAGIYLMSPEVLSRIPSGEFFDMPTLFEKLIAEKLKVQSYLLRGYWLDIGQAKDYDRANSEYYEVF